jgi:hypothetical protein
MLAATCSDASCNRMGRSSLTPPERGAIRAEDGASANKGVRDTMADNTYNGWTNYETWRVNLEMFDADFSSENNSDAYNLGQDLREMALETVGAQASGIALDYAEAFLNSVNWYEIASMNIDAYRPAPIGVDA